MQYPAAFVSLHFYSGWAEDGLITKPKYVTNL